ncbi:MAG: hypothetical protein Tsb0013_11710 [Phycisphaerales bacterium]
MIKKATLSLALLGATPLMSGCEYGTWFALGGTTTGLGMAGTGSVAATAAVHSTARYGRFGPRVTIRNESGREVAARLWVAKVDSRDPSGFTDMRTDDDLGVVLEPGACAVKRPDKMSWSTARLDAIVWAQVAPVDASEAPLWIAFDRPGPFELVLIDSEDGLTIDPDRTSPYGPVPTDRRIVGRVGEHPVWDSADTAG